MSRHRIFAACLVGTCLLAPWSAGAQVGAELCLSAGLAAAHRVAAGSGAASGAMGGLAGYLTWRGLKAGPVVTMVEGDGRVADSSLYLGAAAGFTTRLSGAWRLTALAEGGSHRLFALREHRYARSFSSMSLREDVVLPYAGVRGGITFEQRYERAWPNLWATSASWGVHVFARRDLRDGTAVVEYWDWSLFYPAPRTRISYAIGGWSVGFTIELSAGW
jgi:hypothetical protein